jgi:hypothetical protein
MNKPAPQAQTKTITAKSLVSAFALAVAVILLMPTTLIIAVGMLPTAVAVFVDNSRERLAGLTLGCMNFAGVMLPLLQLWKTGHTVDIAVSILVQPYMLLMMYGGAAVGLLLYINTPLMVSGILRRQAMNRLKAIERSHAELQEEWGPEVANIVVVRESPANQKEH